MPEVIPFLTYEDGIAALEWLAEAFGFTETARITSPAGRAVSRRDVGRKWADHAGESVAGLRRPKAASRPLSDCRLMVGSAMDH